jgi:hypothetical protein
VRSGEITTRRPFGNVMFSIGMFSCVKNPPNRNVPAKRKATR